MPSAAATHAARTHGKRSTIGCSLANIQWQQIESETIMVFLQIMLLRYLLKLFISLFIHVRCQVTYVLRHSVESDNLKIRIQSVHFEATQHVPTVSQWANMQWRASQCVQTCEKGRTVNELSNHADFYAARFDLPLCCIHTNTNDASFRTHPVAASCRCRQIVQLFHLRLPVFFLLLFS